MWFHFGNRLMDLRYSDSMAIEALIIIAYMCYIIHIYHFQQIIIWATLWCTELQKPRFKMRWHCFIFLMDLTVFYEQIGELISDYNEKSRDDFRFAVPQQK